MVAEDLGTQREQTSMSVAPDTQAKKLPSSLESPVEGRNATLVECKKKSKEKRIRMREVNQDWNKNFSLLFVCPESVSLS